MSDSPLPLRAPPLPRRGTGRWLASEWGLAVLALVLAILVWAVVWGHIADEVQVKAGLDLRCSKDFVAYADGEVVFTLRGPRGELDEAQKALGSRVVVHLSDLPSNEDENEQIPITYLDQFDLPFPRRLVAHVEGTRGEMYRLRERRIRIGDLKVVGLPESYDAEVVLEPPTVSVLAPAGKLKDAIVPNSEDVSSLFRAYRDGAVPPPLILEVSFEDWREQPDEKRYREPIEMPTVEATIRFYWKEGRRIRNRIEFRFPAGFDPKEFVLDPDPDVVDQGRYRGLFEGPVEELDALQDNLDEWWYVVRIPSAELPGEADGEDTASQWIEYVDVDAARRRRLEFKPGPQLLVGIERRAP